MKINLLTQRDAEVILNDSELVSMGVDAGSFSLCRPDEQRLLSLIFQLLDSACGLARDGCAILVEYSPFSDGCVFNFHFTDTPGARLYIFEEADDMLDAMNNLRCGDGFDFSCMSIQRAGDNFLMYIAHSEALSPHNLVVLSEYCA